MSDAKTDAAIKKLKQRQKRLAILTFCILALFLLALFGFLRFLRQISPPAAEDVQSLSDYIREQWQSYTLLSFDGKENTAYIRADALIRYDQAERFGASVYDAAMLNSYVSTAAGIARGLQRDCGLEGCTVVLQLFSSDDKIILSASADGSLDTCWASAP